MRTLLRPAVPSLLAVAVAVIALAMSTVAVAPPLAEAGLVGTPKEGETVDVDPETGIALTFPWMQEGPPSVAVRGANLASQPFVPNDLHVVSQGVMGASLPVSLFTPGGMLYSGLTGPVNVSMSFSQCTGYPTPHCYGGPGGGGTFYYHIPELTPETYTACGQVKTARKSGACSKRSKAAAFFMSPRPVTYELCVDLPKHSKYCNHSRQAAAGTLSIDKLGIHLPGKYRFTWNVTDQTWPENTKKVTRHFFRRST